MLQWEVQNNVSCYSNNNTSVKAVWVLHVPQYFRTLPACVYIWFHKVFRNNNLNFNETTETWWHRWLLEHYDAQHEELSADRQVLPTGADLHTHTHTPHHRPTSSLWASSRHSLRSSHVHSCIIFLRVSLRSSRHLNPHLTQFGVFTVLLWRHNVASPDRHTVICVPLTINTQYETEASVWQL